MRNVISWKYTLQTKHIQNIENKLNYGENRKTFLIQQAGMCNGCLETGQIDHILPIW